MNYFTNENDVNKFNSVSPNGSDENGRNKNTAGILDIFVTSIIRINKLAEICVENSKKFIAYVIFMSVLVSFMSFLVPSASRIYSFGGFRKLFLEEFPAFTVKNGSLIADKKFEMRMNNAYLVINTDIDEFSADDFESSGIYMAFGKRNVKLVSYVDNNGNINYSEVYSYPISMMIPSGLNNEKLADISVAFYFSYLLIFIVLTFISAIKYIFLALLYAFFTRSTTSISKLNLSMKDSLHLCFYAETISIILVNLNKAIGEYIPSLFMSIIGIVITVVVILNAIKPHLPDMDEFLNNFGGDNDNS